MVEETYPPLPKYDTQWKKGTPYSFGGINVLIEFLPGDIRSKQRGAVTISNVMPVAYGYILGTTDVHGEEIDVYIARSPKVTHPIFVIDQINPSDKTFDEHKVMLGFSNMDEVVETYVSVFSDGSGKSRLGAITELTEDEFLLWLDQDGSTIIPMSRFWKDLGTSEEFNPFNASPNQAAAGGSHSLPVIDHTGAVVVELPDLSGGPKLIKAALSEESSKYTLRLYSTIEQMVWTNTFDDLCRAMALATDKDEFHIHIASRGGSVVLMGRVISAMRSTKAKVITYAEGDVASAATNIWAFGKERHICPGAYFMQHMSSQGLEGNTTDIVAKSTFCRDYVIRMMQRLLDIGLFTREELDDMIDRQGDAYISGREAISRVGEVSSDD